MGFGHEAHLVAGRLEDRGQTHAGRTLAVGAGDQRTAQSAIDGAKSVEDGAGSLGAELHAEPAKP